METMAYVVLPGLQVKDFNAESNQYVVGIPAMTGFTGFGHGIERELNRLGWALQVEGVAVMLHDLRLHEGHPKCPAAMLGAKDFINPPIIEEIKGDMRVTLVLRLVGNYDDEALSQKLADSFASVETRQALYNWIHANPCCGGSCHDLKALRLLVATETEDDDLLLKALRRLQQHDKGFWVVPRDDLLSERQAEGQDVLDALLDTQRRMKQADGRWRRDAWIGDEKRWLVPLAIGYQAIEAPQPRQGVRKAAPHIYAEPLTGLGELVYASHWLWRPDFVMDSVFWVHRHDAQQQTYFVTTLQAEA
ncbi:MAG: hypothetical protein BWK73_18355 [Thiothrix lacustris]|uniref:Type I-F CRISPR-associated protein Csy2 n=1 Tax=Thiothrix lacustris TaxID=525917 RepID=A0A1Y1QQ53_9GAMM|nr:MAG: hypothetical protein BWK73_18355 [Thiothrix lacustris]